MFWLIKFQWLCLGCCPEAGSCTAFTIQAENSCIHPFLWHNWYMQWHRYLWGMYTGLEASHWPSASPKTLIYCWMLWHAADCQLLPGQMLRDCRFLPAGWPEQLCTGFFSHVRVFALRSSPSFILISFSLLLWVLQCLVGSSGDLLALFFALPRRFSKVVVISTSAAISIAQSLIRMVDHVRVNGSHVTFRTVKVGHIHVVRYSLPFPHYLLLL